MSSVKASPEEEQRIILDFSIASSTQDYARLEEILASPYANHQKLLYIAVTRYLDAGVKVLTARNVRLEAQAFTALLNHAVLNQIPVTQMVALFQYSAAPINKDLLAEPFCRVVQMGRIDVIVFFLANFPVLIHDFIGRHAGQIPTQAELQKDALVIQQLLTFGTAEFFRYFLMHYPKNMPHSDENRATFQTIASKRNTDSKELLTLLTQHGLTQAGNTLQGMGVSIEDLMRNYQRWPTSEDPKVQWHMPYYGEGVYEAPDGQRVIISDGTDGKPALSLPVPPILQRRRTKLVDIWTKRKKGSARNTAMSAVAATPHNPLRATRIDQPVNAQAPENPRGAFLQPCPFGTGCPYQSQDSHTNHFAHGHPFPYAQSEGMKSNCDNQSRPFPLPPCPHTSQCKLMNVEEHMQTYSHPCQHPHLKTCWLIQSPLHNRHYYH